MSLFQFHLSWAPSAEQTFKMLTALLVSTYLWVFCFQGSQTLTCPQSPFPPGDCDEGLVAMMGVVSCLPQPLCSHQGQ